VPVGRVAVSSSYASSSTWHVTTVSYYGTKEMYVRYDTKLADERRRIPLPRTNVNRMLAIHRAFHEEPQKIGHLGYSAPPLDLLEFLSNVYRKSMK
jgi:hypothetical protein